MPVSVVQAARTKTKRVVIGTGKGKAKPGTKARVRFKLNKKGAKLLRKLKKMRVQLKLVLRANGTGGHVKAYKKAIVIKMPKKPVRRR